MKSYAVMKLLDSISLCAPSGAEIETAQIKGLHGFIPVYATLEQAEEASEDGKYKIQIIQTINADE